MRSPLFSAAVVVDVVVPDSFVDVVVAGDLTVLTNTSLPTPVVARLFPIGLFSLEGGVTETFIPAATTSFSSLNLRATSMATELDDQ